MAATKGDSKVNIMDAAEALFAEKGFDATTTREIAQRSGDTLGTLGYHFGSKAVLLKEIFERRFDRVADLRTEYYRSAAAQAADGQLALSDVVEAMIGPYLDLTLDGGPGWQNYIVLLGRTRESGNLDQQNFFLTIVANPMEKCIGWLATVAPRASRTELVYAYEFANALGILECSRTAQNRLTHFARGKAGDLRVTRERLLTFVTAGVAAILP